ncbi:hypothetical protein [Chryseobacterium caseinilyticum]|uniref:Uncharacterized protein n=1 Tax=Chryseobacterium caseinilyticum TaxID=2771428 RepID=A0ABR8Z9P8_9FLAO|nr:hypothetical protein [Chryseobacterium caseinilyticum]MBD8081948.1 hypothetical protein [Chryseobacterium caseinilyticum]
MKTFTKALLIAALSAGWISAFAQLNFKDEKLKLLDELISISKNDIKSVLKEKGYSLKESADMNGSSMYRFANSSNKQNIALAYINKNKPYGITLETQNSISGAESELKENRFQKVDNSDNEYKKEGYKNFYRVYSDKEENSIMMLTQEYYETIPSKSDRPVTYSKMKDLLGLNNQSVKKSLSNKKYYYQQDMDEKDGRLNYEYFSDQDFDLDVKIAFDAGNSVGIEVDGITKEEYNAFESWAKTNNFIKGESSGLTTKQVIWKSKDMMAVFRYAIGYGDNTPISIGLYNFN